MDLPGLDCVQHNKVAWKKKKKNTEILESISSSKQKSRAEAGSIGAPKKSGAQLRCVEGLGAAGVTLQCGGQNKTWLPFSCAPSHEVLGTSGRGWFVAHASLAGLETFPQQIGCARSSWVRCKPFPNPGLRVLGAAKEARARKLRC